MVYLNVVFFALLINRVCFICCDKIECEVRTRIESGWICGKRRVAHDGSEYASFRGVPYARQPVGHLRFQELRSATPWNDYLDATEERPVCPQHDEVFARLMRPQQGMSEACIYANIHVPPQYSTDLRYHDSRHEKAHSRHSDIIEVSMGGLIAHSDLFQTTMHGKGFNIMEDGEENNGLPILVYIHGGAFQSGSGDADLNGPEYLVSNGVIVITFNYRINVFGFLYLNTSKVPGNQGLRDQVTLLRWVQRNARAFGGDPDNVTIMGQSAGASCAHLLSLSKATRGLYQRMILSSGTGNPGFYTTSPVYSATVAASFLARLGINTTDPDDIHDQLVDMPLNRILLANSEEQFQGGFISFTPVVETAFPGVTRILDDDPTELIKNGRGNEYAIMIGFNTAECEIFEPKTKYLGLVDRIGVNPILMLNPRITFQSPPNVALELAKQSIRRYSKKGPRLTNDELIKSCSESLFEYPAFELANLRAKSGGAPTFLYQFSYENEVNFVKISYWVTNSGTVHIQDFSNIFRPNALMEEIGEKVLTQEDEEMKDWMVMFVVNFMRCSDPTCSPLSHQSPWPAVQPGRFNYQRVHKPNVFSNSGPTPRQQDLIHFYEYIYSKSRSSVSNASALTDGSTVADILNTNKTDLINFKRPKFPLAIVYTPTFTKKNNEFL